MDDQSDDCEESDDFCGGSRAVEKVLTTARLVLRTPRMADAEAITEIANNRKVAEQTRRMPHPYRIEDAREWIAMVRDGGERTFLVTRRGKSTIIGAAGCGAMDEADKEVGYWIGEPYWGQGYATEAIQAVIDHVFSSEPLERVYGRCRVMNTASRRVLVKCGFQLAGSAMSDSRAVGGVVPVEEFVLERSVWASLKRWGKAS